MSKSFLVSLFFYLLFISPLSASINYSCKSAFSSTYKLKKASVIRAFKAHNINNDFLIQNAQHIINPKLLQLILRMHSHPSFHFSNITYEMLINKNKDYILNNFGKNDYASEAMLFILNNSRSEYWLRDSDISAVTQITTKLQRDIVIHFVELFQVLPQKVINIDYRLHNMPVASWNGYFVASEVLPAVSNSGHNKYSLALIKLYLNEFPIKENIKNVRARLKILSEIDFLNINNKWQFLMALKILNHETYNQLNRVTLNEGFKANIFISNLGKIKDKQSYYKFRDYIDSIITLKKFDINVLVNL